MLIEEVLEWAFSVIIIIIINYDASS